MAAQDTRNGVSSVSVNIAPGPPSADPAALLLQAAEAAKCAACGCAHEAATALAALPADASPRLRDAAGRLGRLAGRAALCPPGLHGVLARRGAQYRAIIADRPGPARAANQAGLGR